ncbi:hypothetical protein [Micromonospora inyonensis]|uniref:Uncharacterized protein n=1 Tax=Micromonospora inyonensis TaxID=47866 RepID=A0A1C6R7F4_9ACTN|nr:hypothetical protein [Micromonospora inyonensis]SCL12870.1 hypothetical protein GA0074694_0044 [Micromonospora inyonensis]
MAGKDTDWHRHYELLAVTSVRRPTRQPSPGPVAGGTLLGLAAPHANRRTA